MSDAFAIDLTRRPATSAADGELAWESTVTAPTEWVPYVYTDAELKRAGARRALSVASLLLGAAGMLGGLVTIWFAPLALAGVILALRARQVEAKARALWGAGLLAGVVGLLLAVLWLVYILNFAPHRS